MKRLQSTAMVLVLLAWMPLAASAIEEVVVDKFINIPAPQEEVISVRLSHEEVWVPGYWKRDLGKWTWVSGRWEKPPHAAAH